MFTFNATFFFVLASFVLYTLLMKVLFFDPITRVRQERQRYIQGLQASTDKALQEAVSLGEALKAERQASRRSVNLWLDEQYTQRKQAQQTEVAQLKLAQQQQVQAQQQQLQVWKQEASQQMQAQQLRPFTQQVLEKLGLASVALPLG